MSLNEEEWVVYTYNTWGAVKSKYMLFQELSNRQYADRNSRRSRLLLTVISIAKDDRLDSGELFAGIGLLMFLFSTVGSSDVKA